MVFFQIVLFQPPPLHLTIGFEYCRLHFKNFPQTDLIIAFEIYVLLLQFSPQMVLFRINLPLQNYPKKEMGSLIPIRTKMVREKE